MNDIEKSIEILKQQVKLYSCSQSDCPCKHEKICNEIQEESLYPSAKGYIVYQANKIAIEALEKQIPKKVKWTSAYQSYFSAGDEAEPLCPVCGNLLEDDQKICLECFQLLDWN